jgi:hypothetical protein
MPVQAKTPPLLPGLSPVGGKPVIVLRDNLDENLRRSG